MNVDDIAKRVEGTVEGDGSRDITGLASLADAASGDLAFLSNPRYASQMESTGASAVIVSASWEGACPATLIRVADPDLAFTTAASLLMPPPPKPEPGVHPSAVVMDDARLGEDVSVGPHCVIEAGVRIGKGTVLMAGCYVGRGVTLGADCTLYPHVSIRERCRLGDRVVVHNGTVIGSDGFGYVRLEDGWKKIPQCGVVEIEDDVELGANVTVDRARFGKTVIEQGVKVDNLVQVAHNVRIGRATAIASQCGISGSTTIGSNVQMGGQAGVAGHVHVGDGAVCGAQSGVTKDVPAGTFVSGYPAMPHSKARRMHAHVMRLPELKKRLAELEREVGALRERLGETGNSE